MDSNMLASTGQADAVAVEVFERFCGASTMKQILGLYREICNVVKMKPSNISEFYPALKSRLIKSWKAQAIFRKLDMKYNSKIYNQGKVCPNTRVLIIGAGPCGMRAAIDAQLLGAKVVVIEKRDRMSRNNVLHLWPFVIEDLRNLGAKKFLGKFCAGSIDHISIRQLQHILLKVALLLGIEFHEGVSFENLIEPLENEKNGWKAALTPVDHPVSHYEFDVLIGADGKRNTLPGFKRKEFRGRLAIAITANFINRHSKEEASVQEISGTAFIFNQQFFKDLKKEFSIDLENIVYYKDDTHYFVMTAKKQSLIERNVLLQDYPETVKLLSRENINYPALRAYALDAAGYSTDFGLPDLEFAVNHYGQPDVAVFDFTSMFAAENASKVLEKNNHKLLVCLVGDSLLEPFWPTGSGCARGFLSSLDACWAIRSWGMGLHPLAVLAERESIYRILAQTTPQNLNPDLVHYTVDPTTRYLALNKAAVGIHQILYLYHSDNPNVFKNVDQIELVPQIPTKKRKRETLVHHDTLLLWFKKQLVLFNTIKVENLTTSFKDGLVLCAVLHVYRPDLIDFSVIDFTNPVQNNEIAFQLLKQLGISPVMTAQEMVTTDVPNITTMVMYLSQIYQTFKGEIPVMKHKKMDSPEPEKTRHSSRSSGILDPATVISNNAGAATGRATLDSETRRKNRKHRTSSHTSSSKYVGTPVEQRRRIFEEEPEENLNDEEKYNRRLLRILFIKQQHMKSVHMLHTNSKDNVPGFSSLEDADLVLYRQNTINMDQRINNLEKLMNPETRDKSSGNLGRSALNDDFTKKVKNMEDQFRVNAAASNKKPKDLLRAIGKIETTDWNYREIEKKIHENRMGRPLPHEKEKVPRWNREQFLARQTRIVEHGAERVDGGDGKFHDIDSSLKQLDRQLKEGNVLERGERGKNKVASLAGQFAKKDDEEVTKAPGTQNPKVPLKMNIGKKAEMCHLCKTEVYLVERISPEEGLILHKSCFKCHHCSTALKIGSYSFDRDGRYQHNVFCPHHFGLLNKTSRPAKNIVNPVNITPVLVSNVYAHTSPVNESIPDFHLVDRDQTPERIEIESQIDAEEEYNEMDEDEWTDKNFGTSAAIDDTSDAEDEDSSSGDEDGSKRGKESCSDSEESDDDGDDDDDDEDDSDEYTSESSEQFSCRDSSGDEEGASGTWGSEQQIALDKRRQEVALGPLPPSTSPTDTEVASESSSKNSEAANSATEVSTDSEFAHDDPTPTCEVPVILCNDRKIKQNERNWETAIEKKKAAKNENLKTNVNNFAKVQVTSRIIANGNLEKKNKPEEQHIKLELKSPITPIKVPLAIPRPGDYLLSRTQSTSGIATKRALELKKKYLLGPQATIGLQKSDSASELDSKFRAFHSNISECQKLLNPAPDISPSMQAFLDNSSRRNAGGLLSPTNMNKLPAIAVESIPTSPSYVYSNMTNYPFTKSNNNEIISDKPKKTIENIADNPPVSIPDVVQASMNSNTILIKEDSPVTIKRNSKETIKEIEDNIPVKPLHSPIFETSIVVPKIPWKNIKKHDYPSGTDIDSDSLHSFGSSSDDVSGKHNTQSNISVPRVEIMKPCGEIMQLDSLMVVNGEYIGPQDSDDDITISKINAPKQQVNETTSKKAEKTEKPLKLIKLVSLYEGKNNQGQAISSSDSGNDITAFFTDNEPLDWAVEGSTADMGLKQPHGRTTHSQNHDTAWKAFALDNFDQSEHVCGKHVDKEVKKISNILDCDHSDIDFMDTGSEESLIENQDNVNIRKSINTGFIEFVDVCVSNQRDVLPKSPLVEAVNRHCDSPVNDRSINFIEQGACILNNDQFSIEYGNSLCENENEPKVESVSSLEEKETVEYKCDQEEDGFLIVSVQNDNVDIKPNDDANNYSLCDTELTSVDDNNSSNHNSISTNTNEFLSHNNSNSTNSVFESPIATYENKDTPKKICNSPATTRKLEEIFKEKNKQKDLIHQLVMDKMSKLSDKRSDRRSRSPITIPQLTLISNKVESAENLDIQKSPPKTPKIDEPPIKKSHKHLDSPKKESTKSSSHPKHSISLKIKPLNDYESYAKTKHPNNSETFSLPDIHQSVLEENKFDKLRKVEDSKVPKKRILSEDSSLDYSHFSQPGGIVPGFRKLSLNDFSGKLVQHVESLRSSSPNHETYQSLNPSSSLCTSDPNFLTSENVSKKNKGRDTERRKSIIKTVSDFFSRRRDTTGHTNNPSSLDDKKNKSPPGQKFKNKSNDAEIQKISHFDISNEVPPPIPPLPMNYCSVQSTSGYHDGNINVQQSPPLCVPVTKKITAKKRCNSLNEIQNKINETEKCLEKIEDMRAQAWNKLHSKTGGEERVLLQDCLSLNKYYENLVKQRNSQTTRAHELLLEERQQQLRLKLRDVLNGGKDTNHTQENAIINEMMAIVAERQNLSSSRRLND